MSTTWAEKTDTELVKVFLRFKEAAIVLLKERRQTWASGLKELPWPRALSKLRFKNRENSSFNDTSVDRNVKRAEGEEFGKMGDTRTDANLYLIELMKQAERSWKLKIKDDGSIEILKDKRKEYTHAAHYLCFYWLHDDDAEKKHDGIDIAYMGFFTNKNPAPQYCLLEFFGRHSYSGLQKNHLPEPSTIAASNEGDITCYDQTMILRMEGLDKPNVKSQFSILLKNKLSEIRELPESMQGTYNTVGFEEWIGKPMAGLLYFKKYDSREAAMRFLADPKSVVPYEIYHYLFGSQLMIGKDTIAMRESFSIDREISELASYAGVYQGDILSIYRKDDPLHESIVVVIFPNTRAVIYVPDADKPEPENMRTYHGRMRVVKQFLHNLVGSFDSTSESRVSRFTLYIHRRLKEHSSTTKARYYGVYAGVEHDSERLVSGRIRLTKSDVSVNSDEAVFKRMVKSKSVKDTDLQSDPDLMQLFSGAGHEFDFVGTLPQQHYASAGSFKQSAAKLFPFAGRYFIYELSHVQNFVVKTPVEVNQEAKVISYGEHEQMAGDAKCLPGKLLTFTGYDTGNNLPVSHHLFSIIDVSKYENLGHAFGVSSGLAIDGRPAAHIKVLVRCRQQWPEMPVAQNLEIGSEPFQEEDTALSGLLSWLSGRYDRVFKSPQKPNIFHPHRRHVEKYVYIHFYAACYHAGKKEINKTVLHLYQAYLHGFDVAEWLDKEAAPEGCFHPILDKAAKKLKTYEDRSDYPDITIRKLIDMIRERIDFKNMLQGSDMDDGH